MNHLYEESDIINVPFECFYYNTLYWQFSIRPHWHYYMEILLVLAGEAEIHVDNDIYRIRKGDMILFHPKSVHAIYRIDKEELACAVIKLDMNRITTSSNYVPRIKSIFKLAKRRKTDIFIEGKSVKEMGLEPIFHRCIYEMQTKNYGYDIIIQSQLCQMLIMILRYWQDRGFVVDSAAFAEDESLDIYSISQYIDENIDKNIRVSEVAESCGMSYSYFAKKFRMVYGKSCKEYIEEMRIYKVEELLVFTDFDMTYISQATGFSDCSHMIRCFKLHKGVTPKQFRMNLKI
ncbi:MAG: AraC family transcriptional regulator [Lachnospiraceae bacterium]